MIDVIVVEQMISKWCCKNIVLHKSNAIENLDCKQKRIMNTVRALDDGSPTLRFCYLDKNPHSLGIHLSRAVWDPYPLISEVVVGSSAEQAGVKVGDLLLEVNGKDMLGQKVADVAQKIKHTQEDNNNESNSVTLLLWNSGAEHKHWNPRSVPRFAGCMQNVAQLLECPVCLDVVRRPIYQCMNGHLLCIKCQYKTLECPVCRISLDNKTRCLVAEKLLGLIVDTFANRQKRLLCVNNKGHI